jgi:hypothetical protein
MQNVSLQIYCEGYRFRKCNICNKDCLVLEAGCLKEMSSILALTHSAIVYEPNRGGGGREVSANEYSCAHGV